jgi:alpha-glucosidase
MPEFVGQMPSVPPTWSTMGAVQQVEFSQTAILIKGELAQLSLTLLAANLVRVRFSPMHLKRLPRRSWAVTRDDQNWLPVPYKSRETPEIIEIITAQLWIQVERATGKLCWFDPAGRPFAADVAEGMAWQTDQIAAWRRIEPDEHFYGFGERAGLLDKLGQRFTNWTTDSLDYHALTDAMYQAIPFFMALRPQVGYGIFLNSTHWSCFDIGAEQTGVWQMTSHSPELDYYLIYGPSPAAILETYTSLTGRMPLPPQWALGYHQCRWSYRSEAEVRELATQFRQRQIPCDVIHLDIDYMQGFRVFTWSNERFPNPAQLIADLTQAGFKVVTIVDPGVKYEPDTDYRVLNQGLEQDYFVRHRDGRIFHGYVWPDRAVFPDFMRAKVRQWWGDQHRALTEAGVAGIWNDMNEPALNDRPFGDPGDKIPLPLDAPQGGAQEQTTHAETHNLYGQMMARAAAEGLERLRPNQRSFVLTRAGFAGIQNWSAVWTGDNHSRWEYLEMSLPMLANLGLSGVAFVGADIGGFAGNATAELFARWMQVGMLYPLMRAHSSIISMQHEPWVFGPEVEQICRQYIELRYQLLPYLYTLFWQAATTGAPILRPLLYDFPDDPQVTQLHDQVMLGPSLMAAPILRPGVECRAVYLPAGTWFDWWTGEQFENQNSSYILAPAPLDRMPLYVRAGAIIPLAPIRQHVDQLPDQLRIKIWPGIELETTTGTIYEDDGESFAYKTGSWAITTYQVETIGEHVQIDIQPRTGDYEQPNRTVTIEVVGAGEQMFTDDGTARSLSFVLGSA